MGEVEEAAARGRPESQARGARVLSDGPCGSGDVVSFAPGRVNLIGDHTDYTGGFAMPLALSAGTEVTFLPDPSASEVKLSSAGEEEPVSVSLTIKEDPVEVAMVLPEWGRYVAGVVAAVRPRAGGQGTISSALPAGAGLSSSASLEVALALALGAEESPAFLARRCQRAEHLATGTETGILDQLAIASAREGNAMLIDCDSLEVTQVPVPAEAEFVAVHCGVARRVERSDYDRRRKECAAAETEIGPLRRASVHDVDAIRDPLVRKRARHVVSENARTLGFKSSLEHGDLRQAGALMSDSHRSLATDFEVSLPELDALVKWLEEQPGVYGARLSGAGFGGCAVALSEAGALDGLLETRWHVVARPSRGAHRRPS